MSFTRLLTALVALTVLGGACSFEVTRSSENPTGADVTIEQADEAPAASDTAKVVERLQPSVVTVRVTQFGPNFGGSGAEGQGSGVVVDPDGYIVTNNHVVSGAAEVEVVIPGRDDKLPGSVIGTAPEKDIAVIKVDASDLPAVTVGESSKLRLGDDVIALGYPLGLGGITVTKGIVAGLNRNISVGGGAGEGGRLEGLLQTDAAINPGNSGGALVNAAGQLVGINTAAAQASSAENIGFAIAIDSALPIVQEIIEDPPEERAWLGVSIATISSAADAVDVGVAPDVRGVAVLEVFPQGPARAAGVEPGEVITAVDGNTIDTQEDLTKTLTRLDPGETVALTLVGPNGAREVDVELGKRPLTLD